MRKMDNTSKYAAKKRVGMCCIGGKIILPVLQVLPMELFTYMIGNISESKQCLQNI